MPGAGRCSRGGARQRSCRGAIVTEPPEPGATSRGVAAGLGVSLPTVALRRRFVERGPDGLLEEPKPGASRKITDEQVEQAVAATLKATPADATHWQCDREAVRNGHEPYNPDF